MSSESILSQMQQHDIQQRAARETNVLDDPSLVTDASQVMAFVRDFYRFYDAAKRAQYNEENKNKAILSMANKLVRYNPNPTEPILVNENFYKMWTEMSQRVEDWFALNGEKDAEPDNISTLTYKLLENLEQDYKSYTNRLKMVQENIIQTLSERDVMVDTLKKSQIDINTTILADIKKKRDEEIAMNASVARSMEEEKKKVAKSTTPVVPVIPAVPMAPTVPATPAVPVTPTVPVIPATPAVPVTPTAPVIPTIPATPTVPVIPAAPAKSAEEKRKEEELARYTAAVKLMEEKKKKRVTPTSIIAPFPIGAPEPQLAEIITGTSDIPATKARLAFVTPNFTPTKTVEKEAAEKYEMLQLAGDNKESYDRVIAYYKDIIKTIGDAMLSLFRSMNFPVVISLRPPQFTDLWTEYLDSALYDFLSQAKVRSKGQRDLRHKNFDWDEHDITVAWLITTAEKRTYFADFVGHRLTIYPLILTPGEHIVRPNRMTDNAAHLAAMKFVKLYNHVIELLLKEPLHKKARFHYSLSTI